MLRTAIRTKIAHAVFKGCTQYIRQSRDPQGLAAAYHNRGVAYMHMGEVDRAIADYDKVVEFSPSYAQQG